MSRKLKLALAQLNWVVGDIEGNCERMLATVKAQEDADLVLFSELALCGYSPEDLLFRPDFQQRCEEQLVRLEQASKKTPLWLGILGGKTVLSIMHCHFSIKVSYRRVTSNNSYLIMVYLMKNVISSKEMNVVLCL